MWITQTFAIQIEKLRNSRVFHFVSCNHLLVTLAQYQLTIAIYSSEVFHSMLAFKKCLIIA